MLEYLPVFSKNHDIFGKYNILNHDNTSSYDIGLYTGFEYCLPTSIKVLIYSSLILSKNRILIWGYQSENILILQRKALRIISL